MAKTYPSGATGAVTLPTGHGADIASFSLSESQDSESVAFYGSNLYNPFRGSGTFHMSASVAAFSAYGNAGLSPGFGAATNVGGSTTFGIASTAVQIVGNFIVSQIALMHARLRAAIPLTFALENSSDSVITTWPVS